MSIYKSLLTIAALLSLYILSTTTAYAATDISHTISHKTTLYDVDLTPSSLMLYDLDKDGNKDIITANSAAGDISVLYNRGSGTFKKAVYYRSCTAPSDISAGDFNGDGRADIAVACPETSEIIVYRHEGGHFKALPSIALLSSIEKIKIVDFNGDGFDDILAISQHTSSATVIYGSKDNRFNSSRIFLGASAASPSAILTEYPGQKSKNKFIIFNEKSSNASLLGVSEKGNLELIKIIDFKRYSISGASKIVSDKQTGQQKVALISRSRLKVYVYLLSRQSTFIKKTEIDLTSSPSRIAMVDYNGDGFDDILVSLPHEGVLKIFYGNKQKSYEKTTSEIVIGPNAVDFILFDLNKDGVLDIVNVNRASADISVHLSSSP